MDSQLSGLLDDAEFVVDCTCGHQLTVSLSDCGKTVTCPRCNAEIELVDDGNVISNIADSLASLDKTVDSF